MLERFLRAFPATERGPAAPVTDIQGAGSVIAALGGCGYGNGLYRVHNAATALRADGYVREAFPAFAGRLTCFGYDWLGRHFAADRQRGTQEDPEVLMFEPGTGLVLEIPVPISLFHDEELVDHHDAALASEFFDEWLEVGGRSPQLDQCIGYRRPLFLGGQDTVSNLEVTDLDVYWTIAGQLINITSSSKDDSSIADPKAPPRGSS